MKKACIITLIFVLMAVLFAGCRNMGDTTPTTIKPTTSSSTRPTVVPTPEIPMPSGTSTVPSTPTNPGRPDTTTMPSGTEMPGRSGRAATRSPRY